MLCLYALLATSFLELFEPLVFEGLDHAKIVACCATLVKMRNAYGSGQPVRPPGDHSERTARLCYVF